MEKWGKMCQGVPMLVAYVMIKLLVQTVHGKQVSHPSPNQGDPLTSPVRPTPEWLWLEILKPYAGLM